MSENKYPIDRQGQIDLWRECLTDAREITQEYVYQVPVSCALFQYRIGILSSQVVDHDMLDLDDDIPLLDKDES